MPRERRSYVILRDDGLLLHTKPITEGKAKWLYQIAYKEIENREAKIRYLEEYGNVLDVEDYVEQMRQLGADPYYIIGVYEDPDYFMKKVDGLLGLRNLQPEARQLIREFADRVREFLQKPVEPKPIVAPVRYYEMYGRHIRFDLPDIDLEVVTPRPMWYGYVCGDPCYDVSYGISVFKNYLWLWGQYEDDRTHVVVVRRNVNDRDVVAALVDDDDVMSFLRENADDFRELLREREKELIDKGYEDVVRKVKVILTTLDLLDTGRREEEEEGLPA